MMVGLLDTVGVRFGPQAGLADPERPDYHSR